MEPALRREFSARTILGADKPYYVTTPIFYVNAAPHVGHMYTMILADVLKRWEVLRGKEAILCTGTDEHGMKIQQAAKKADSDPKLFCDKGADIFRTLAARVGMSNDHFVRTTDPSHREAVEYAWHLLEDRGYIYESKHEGWYSVSDETFYPESAVHLILDPPTGRKIMVSMETGKEVQWTSEHNYHFRLSAFRERLLDFYRENPTWITPPSRMKEVVNSVEAGLQDLSVSRPVDRLTWGIRVPTDDTQTIYVWLDALMNYVTKAGYPWMPGSEQAGGWPADVHVIGKDIVRFHCVYWPAFLMALDLPSPKRILTHAHWTLGKQKMAKSTGNVVNPFFALDRFGMDTMRFYLIHNGGLVDDADYENMYIIERYRNDLKNGLGNLVSRILNGKAWNVRDAVQRYEDLQLLEQDCVRYQDTVKEDEKADPYMNVNSNLTEYRRLLTRLPGMIEEHVDNLEPNKALHGIITQVYAANAFFQAQKPWHISQKHTDGSERSKADVVERRGRRDCIIYLSAETLRMLGIMLQPYMPGKAKELLDMLGVAEDRRMWSDARLGADSSYGRTAGGGKRVGALFPPLDCDS